ncbi:MAG: amino acid ABC transporter substrate-binding protein [Clostridia bacterium]|nr:amino acid ABC transporter substrate-binding protein [Clostridia bacterium]
MKKVFKALLALLIVTICVCACTACNKDDAEKEESSKKSSSSRDVSEKDKKIEKEPLKKDNSKSKVAEKKKRKNTESKGNIETGEVLAVLTNAEYPPFEYLEDGEFVGAEIDMANAIAEKLGVEFEFVNADFDSVISGVASGKYVMAISGITVTDQRREVVDFSIPYYVASQAIVVVRESGITSEGDLRGKVIGCQSGTTGEAYATDCGYNVISYNTSSDTMMALLSGRVDAVIIDRDIASGIVSEMGGQAVVLDEKIMPEEYAIAVCPGNKGLLRQINKAITKLKKQGRLEEIFANYGL